MKKQSSSHLDLFARRVAENRGVSDELSRLVYKSKGQSGIRSLLQALSRGVYRVWSRLIGAER